jgi:hypothetical protein
MDWKKYSILAPWALLAGIGMLLFAPFRNYAILPVLILWVIYYAWIYIEDRKIH